MSPRLSKAERAQARRERRMANAVPLLVRLVAILAMVSGATTFLSGLVSLGEDGLRAGIDLVLGALILVLGRAVYRGVPLALDILAGLYVLDIGWFAYQWMTHQADVEPAGGALYVGFQGLILGALLGARGPVRRAAAPAS